MAQYLLPAAFANISIVFRSSKESIFECKIDSFNLIFYTGTSFNVPLDFYDAMFKVLRLFFTLVSFVKIYCLSVGQISSPSAEDSADGPISSVSEVDDLYNLEFCIFNPNPASVSRSCPINTSFHFIIPKTTPSNAFQLPVQRLLINETMSKECVDLPQLGQRARLFCHCREAKVSSLFKQDCKSASVRPCDIPSPFHVSSILILQVFFINTCLRADRSTYGDYFH